MRKLDLRPTPLRERIGLTAPTLEIGAPSAPTAPAATDAPLTAAEICHQVAGLLSELAAALERDDERVDCQLAKLWGRVGGLETSQVDAEWWPLLMDSAQASRYSGYSIWQINDLARQGVLPRISHGEGIGYRYAKADLDALAQSR